MVIVDPPFRRIRCEVLPDRLWQVEATLVSASQVYIVGRDELQKGNTGLCRVFKRSFTQR